MILANLLRQSPPSPAFSPVEVGARPVGETAPFHALLDLFPASRLLGFEPDAERCAQLQREAGARLHRAPTCVQTLIEQSRAAAAAPRPGH